MRADQTAPPEDQYCQRKQWISLRQMLRLNRHHQRN